MRQSPQYPMQLMLNIYDLGDPTVPSGWYPKEFVVDYVRGYRSPPSDDKDKR